MFFNRLGCFGTSLLHIFKQKLKLPGQNFVKFSLGCTIVWSLLFFIHKMFWVGGAGAGTPFGCGFFDFVLREWTFFIRFWDSLLFLESAQYLQVSKLRIFDFWLLTELRVNHSKWVPVKFEVCRPDGYPTHLRRLNYCCDGSTLLSLGKIWGWYH